MSNYRLPRTLLGWRRLFWLSLGRCPIHHTRLSQDWHSASHGACFTCDGVTIWPIGLRQVLWENYMVEAQKQGSDHIVDANKMEGER